MRIVALEEHHVPSSLFAAWAKLAAATRDLSYDKSSTGEIRRRLENLEGERLRQMDRAGIDMQVLSMTTAGVQALCEGEAIEMSRRINDLTAATVRRRPDRFGGFATLPLATPDATVVELRRAIVELGLHGAMIYGRLDERNMDDRHFWPLYEEAARLRAALYVHPQSPLPAVRQAYYSGFSAKLDQSFASGGIGWHYETGVQLLRLILAGVLDAYPDLQLITGHWGEVALFYLDRVDMMGETGDGPKLPVSDYWRSNISVTPSGIFSPKYLAWAIEALGPERIMYSTDYRTGSARTARRGAFSKRPRSTRAPRKRSARAIGNG